LRSLGGIFQSGEKLNLQFHNWRGEPT
jgi:hypothetical protein